jgi:hypothetical protein
MELGGGWSRWTLESGRVSEGFLSLEAGRWQPAAWRVSHGRVWAVGCGRVAVASWAVARGPVGLTDIRIIGYGY